MSSHIDTVPDNNCLNCDESVSGNYCSNCGQKFQPTKLPLRIYLEDTVETLFNVDNRVFKTLKDLFLRPGKITKEYISGHRATYLPPLRIYISISILYFFLAIITESTQVFLVNLGSEEYDPGFAKLLQTAMFILVPLFALIVKWFHRKRNSFYVEYLIFSLHIHSVWFLLLSFSIIASWAYTFFGITEGSFFYYLIATIQILERSLFLIYFVVYLKRVFDNTWWKTFLKTFGVLFLYLISLLLVIAPYIYILFKD